LNRYPNRRTRFPPRRDHFREKPQPKVQFDLRGYKPKLEMCSAKEMGNFQSCLTVDSCRLLNLWWNELNLKLRNYFAGLTTNDDVCSHILSFLPPESLCSMRLVSKQFYNIIEDYNLIDAHADYILQKLQSHITTKNLCSLFWILTGYPQLKLEKQDTVLELFYTSLDKSQCYGSRGNESEQQRIHSLFDGFVQLFPDWFDELVKWFCKREHPVPTHLINHRYFNLGHSSEIWKSFKKIDSVNRYSMEDIDRIMNSSFVKDLTEFEFIAGQRLALWLENTEKFSAIVKHILGKSNQTTQQLVTSFGLAKKENVTFVEQILEWILKESIGARIDFQLFLEEACVALNVPVVRLLIQKRWADPTQQNYRCFKLKVDDNVWVCLLGHPCVDKIHNNNYLFRTASSRPILSKTISELLLDPRVRSLVTDYEYLVLEAIEKSNVTLLDTLFTYFRVDVKQNKTSYLSRAMHPSSADCLKFLLHRPELNPNYHPEIKEFLLSYGRRNFISREVLTYLSARFGFQKSKVRTNCHFHDFY